MLLLSWVARYQIRHIHKRVPMLTCSSPSTTRCVPRFYEQYSFRWLTWSKDVNTYNFEFAALVAALMTALLALMTALLASLTALLASLTALVAAAFSLAAAAFSLAALLFLRFGTKAFCRINVGRRFGTKAFCRINVGRRLLLFIILSFILFAYPQL